MPIISEHAGFVVKLDRRTIVIIDHDGTATPQAMTGAARAANAGEPVRQYAHMPAGGDLSGSQVRAFHRLNMLPHPTH